MADGDSNTAVPPQAIENRRTTKEVQQNFAESLGYSTYIIWDLLSAEQNDVLEAKINQLIPDQSTGQNSINNARTILFDSVWAQRKYTNGNSLSSIIYVLVTNEGDLTNAEQSQVFSCHPVFRTRKCTAANSNSSNSAECCMIFIDEFGRVYHNWKSYTEENTLPAGVMIAPENGIYCLDGLGQVKLSKCWTPASSTTNQVLGFVDTSSAIGGFVAACVPVAAFLTLPVSAPLMAVAGGVGLAAGGYSAIRSGAHLYDRNQHEQSINVTDRQARSSWLGVMGGLVGLGAAGATSRLAATAAAGRDVGLVARCAVNGLNITSIMLSGGGVAHGAFELYLKGQDDEEITALDIVQLSASLALFTHSMYNFRLASRIVSESQTRTIGQIRENLSNRQRRMFDKMSKETIRIRGATRGRMDIIRGVNEVPSRQQLNDVFKINKQLNERGVRPAFAPDGRGVMLNNEVVVNSGELRASVQHNMGPDVLVRVTQPIPESYQSSSDGNGFRPNNNLNQQLVFMGSEGQMMHESVTNDWASGVRALSGSSVTINGVIIALSQFGIIIFNHINNVEGFENVINRMAEIFTEQTFRFIMNLTRTFIQTMLDEILEALGFCIATETVLYRMVKHILETYTFEILDNLEHFTLEIISALREYFLSINPNGNNGSQKCNVCSGFFNICNL